MFGRLLDVKIKNDAGSSITLVDHTLGNKALVSEADIVCMPNQTRTSLVLKINNLDKYTRNIIKTDEYKYITVEFGYRDFNGGTLGKIFEGTLQRMITQRPSPETSLTVMYAYELGDAYNYGFFSGYIPAGTTLYDTAMRIASEGEVQIPLVCSEILKSYVYKNDKSLYGSQMTLLQEIAESVGNIIFMHNMGKVYMITSTENAESEVIVMSGVDEKGKLSSASGLIGLPTLEDDGLSFECLINPNMRIYSTVLISNEFIGNAQEGFEGKASAGAEYDENGLYVVTRIETHVTNGPEESKMNVRALARQYYLEDTE
ncbi:MAG: hypothetical protein RR342_01075 [Bacilli bacterium]